MKTMLPFAAGLCLAVAAPLARAQEKPGIDPRLSQEIRKIVREELRRAMSEMHGQPAAVAEAVEEAAPVQGHRIVMRKGQQIDVTSPRVRVLVQGGDDAEDGGHGNGTGHHVIVRGEKIEVDGDALAKAPRVFHLHDGKLVEVEGGHGAMFVVPGHATVEGKPLPKAIEVRRAGTKAEAGAKKAKGRVVALDDVTEGQPMAIEVEGILAEVREQLGELETVELGAVELEDVAEQIKSIEGELKGMKIEMPKIDTTELRGKLLEVIHGQEGAPKTMILRTKKTSAEAKDCEGCAETCTEACTEACTQACTEAKAATECCEEKAATECCEGAKANEVKAAPTQAIIVAPKAKAAAKPKAAGKIM